ncbi:MAG: zf-HC2 domain-containing protein [Eubacteriales bacterium]|nr:zf-HC2 domain-containing protein [Eubacteriales bacterium]
MMENKESAVESRECAIAKDLMPMRIDKLCSEESERFVDEHVAKCPECAQVYGYMRATVPQQKKTEEAESFKTALSIMKKSAAYKRIKYVLLGIIGAAALLIALFLGFRALCKTYIYPLDKSLYSVNVYKSESGALVLDYDFGDGAAYEGTISFSDSPLEGDDTKCVVSSVYEAARLPLRNNGYWANEEPREFRSYVFIDDKLYWISYDENSTGKLTEVSEIRIGSEDNYTVIYHGGDAVPVISDEKLYYLGSRDSGYAPFATPQPTMPTGYASPLSPPSPAITEEAAASPLPASGFSTKPPEN